MDEKQFSEWYEEPINRLAAYEHGGFAILMIAIPLAERLFRERSESGEKGLKPRFYVEFAKEFSNLTAEQCEQLWQIIRNGLLHQATFSMMDWSGNHMPGLCITAATTNFPHPVEYDFNKNEFVLKPLEFARRIVAIIKADFGTFLAKGAPNHTFAKVFPPPTWAESAQHPFIEQQASATGCTPIVRNPYGAP